MTAASCSLHGFCHTSLGAYAAVVYLVALTGPEQHVRFVASKTRVSLRRELTIPRLELLSALLLTTLLASVTNSLCSSFPLSQPTCYTDSQVVLYRIVGHGKEWKQFIQNRVLEIRELIPAEYWNHCSGTDNPMDIPSCGLTPSELSVNRLWHCGPDWLCNPPKKTSCDVEEMPADCLSKMKSKDRLTH